MAAKTPSRTPGRFKVLAQPALSRPRLPDWFRVKHRLDSNYEDVRRIIKNSGLHTVCSEANCPNIRECWKNRTATFMILGDVCTRGCTFCDVMKGRPTTTDWAEPARVADAALECPQENYPAFRVKWVEIVKVYVPKGVNLETRFSARIEFELECGSRS